MKKSPIFPGYEGGEYGFDPRVDFSEFLEEARTHASKENFEAAPQHQEDTGKRQSDGGNKNNRKSWKRSFFSWWKGGKKNNSSMEPPTRSHSTNARCNRVSASGPIFGIAGGTSKPRRPTSGPLSSLFNTTKRVEDEIQISYICLDKPDNPNGAQSYGPVYLVT